MSRWEPGTRVYALQDADEKKVRSFGLGVYVGDLLISKETPSPTTYEMLEQAIRRQDNTPANESPILAMFDVAVGEGKMTSEEAAEAKEATIASLEAERAKPLEGRVQALWESLNTNPCIHLDNGGIIWGAQCWWGPEDQYEQAIEGREVVELDPPAQNGRWDE